MTSKQSDPHKPAYQLLRAHNGLSDASLSSCISSLISMDSCRRRWKGPRLPKRQDRLWSGCRTSCGRTVSCAGCLTGTMTGRVNLKRAIPIYASERTRLRRVSTARRTLKFWGAFSLVNARQYLAIHCSGRASSDLSNRRCKHPIGHRRRRSLQAAITSFTPGAASASPRRLIL